jgi:copper ion binding protein
MVGSDSACSELEFQVTGMMCEANCAARVKRACEALPGVESANVDFHTGTVRIHPKKNTLSNDIDPVCQSSEPAIPIMDMISLGIAVDQAGYSAMWAGGRRVIRFNIEGMTCGHCVNTVQDALAASGLVMQARVSLDHHCVNIIGDENTDIPAIINLIEDIGYGASVADGNREVDLTTKKMTYRDASVAFSALRAVPGVVCVQITPDRGVIRTRGFASVQSLVLALKSIGVEAKADASSLSPTSTGSASIEARHDVKGPSDSKPLRAAQEVQPVGYIADTKSTFEIKGMTCGACVASVEKAIQKLEGVKQVYVALLTETAEVRK